MDHSEAALQQLQTAKIAKQHETAQLNAEKEVLLSRLNDASVALLHEREHRKHEQQNRRHLEALRKQEEERRKHEEEVAFEALQRQVLFIIMRRVVMVACRFVSHVGAFIAWFVLLGNHARQIWCATVI